MLTDESPGGEESPPSPDGLQIGQDLGSYRVVRKLGEGGMGTVYAAEHQEIGYRAAIKVLHLEFSRHPQIAKRFLNEARAVNIINHPGVVKVFEFGRLPDRSAFIIMEYLDGESLEHYLQRMGGRLPVPTALRLSRQIASALAAAHDRNIVHRDLKPANIMIVADSEAEGCERAKVLDFGLAKVAPGRTDVDQTGLKTRTGVVMGTALYMAPEQCRGASDVDGKADVYGLGVMLYQMLCGQTPFVAGSEGELVTMHLRDEPISLKTRQPTLPDAVAELVSSMLLKDPTARPTMLQVEETLSRLSGRVVGQSQLSLSDIFPEPAGSRGNSGRPVGSGRSGVSDRLPSGGPRLPTWAAIAGGLVLGAGLAGVGLRHWPSLMTSVEPGRPWVSVQSGTKYFLRCVFRVGPQNVWAAGDSGTILHWNGTAWATVPSGTTQSIRSLWGSAPGDIWAAGGHGTILHWNGTAWNPVPGVAPVDYRGLWGSGPGDVWVVGKEGVILHNDGQGFSPVPSGITEDLRGVWGSGPGQLWAVGEYGIVLRWDGTAWSKQDTGTQSWLTNVWGSGPRDVWVVGNQSIILHFDGKTWSRRNHESSTELSSVWGSGPHDVWAVGNEGVVLHFDGKSWSSVNSGTRSWLYGLWGSGPRDVWTVGGEGVTLHYQ